MYTDLRSTYILYISSADQIYLHGRDVIACLKLLSNIMFHLKYVEAYIIEPRFITQSLFKQEWKTMVQ